LGEPSASEAYLASPWVHEHLRPFLSWLLARHQALGGITELRLLRKAKGKGTWSGYFGPEDQDALVQALAPTAEQLRDRIPRGDHPRVGEANVYFSLQPIRPDLAEGRRGTLARSRTASRDRDVLAYSLLVVDVDPEREPRDCSASAEEKARALEVTEQVRAWLHERGVQAIQADSGNGYHLLVPLLPVEDVRCAAKDVKDLLRLLDQRFSTEAAKVDTSTFNPSRILKLYGTKAVKGEDSPARPHRFATVDLGSIPEDVALFDQIAGDLEAYRDARKNERRRKPSTRSPRKKAKRPPGAQPGPSSTWTDWRAQALGSLPLDAVYGELLTGATSGEGWLQCRDPFSSTGDKNPSAGVADGGGQAERGAFHSFRDGRTESVFDFLVRSGRAADFQAACALVAELAGVPMPGGAAPTRSPQEPSKAVAELERRWGETEEQGERLGLLRDAIAALLDLPAAEREPHMKRLRVVSELSARVFRETVSEVRRELRKAKQEAPPPPPEPGRAVVDYVTNRQTVAGLFDDVLAAVAPAQRFFRTERDIVFVRRGVGPVVVTDKNLGGLLSALTEIRFARDGEEGLSFMRYGVMPSELARAFVSDPRVWSQLPQLRLYCRSPLFDARWGFVGSPGYHPGPGIYYDGPRVSPTDEGTPLLHRALADFHWKAEADLVNFVGVLLTALTMPHWGRGHPFLAVNGNKPGVGKTTLARVLGVLVEGAEPNTVSYVPDDTEFEKQIATRVEAGDRIIVVDNAKTSRAIQSAVLERCITDSRLNFRRLGSNSAITRPQNDILFCLTMNLTHLGPDLRRRALPVNLMLDEDVRRTRYALADVVAFVEQHRMEIVAELAGLVNAWIEVGKPGCEKPAMHSTSQAWAATIDAILRLSGFDGFLTNFEESAHAFDPRYELMLDIITEHRGKPAAPAAGWVERLDEQLGERFRDRRGNAKSARAKSTIVGNLFREYLDTRFVVEGKSWHLVRSYPEGEKRKPAYHFEGAEE
jgi:hypothetical protein